MVGDEPYESPEAHSYSGFWGSIPSSFCAFKFSSFYTFSSWQRSKIAPFPKLTRRFYPIWQREITYELERRTAENNREV
jgi:hypothetical protein